jgi:hypothetical protein
MYATDATARRSAAAAGDAGHDQKMPPDARDLPKPVSLITRNQKMAMSPTPRSCVRRHANLF